MLEITNPCVRFKQQLRDCLNNQAFGWRSGKFRKWQYVYTPGEQDEMIYFIETGQVKLILPSSEGKKCLASIRTQGDIFGESCLSGQPARLEMAMTMHDTQVKKISGRDFIQYLKKNSILETFVQYLGAEVSQQLEVIGALTTADCEHLLAKTLLHLGRLLGSANGNLSSVCIPQKISHEELSNIIGTTRPRVGILLKKFRNLGLMQLTPKGFIVIQQHKMRDFLQQDAIEEEARPA